MIAKSVPALGALFLAAACAQQPPGAGASPAPSVCNADPAAFAVGRVATPQLVEEARRRAGARIARVLRPGQVVTMEFNEQRLSVETDLTNKVVRVSCG